MDRNLRIRMLLEAGDKVSRPLRDIAGGSSKAGQALKATRDRLREIERAQDDIGNFRKLKQGLRSSGTELEAARRRVTDLGREISQTATPTAKLTRAFERAKKEARLLEQQHQQNSSRLGDLRARLLAAGVPTNELAQHERRLRNEAAATNRELSEQGRRMQELAGRTKRLATARGNFSRLQGVATGMAASGAAAIGTGMAMGAPILASIKGAQAYQSVMTDIAQKANLSRADAEKMGAGLLVAARAANQLPDQLQEGVDKLAGFGLDPRQAVAMMRPIGRAATAYKAEIGDLSGAAFAAHDNLKVPIADTGRMIDAMAQAGKSGAFEIKDMAQYFPSLTAAYQGLGQSGVKAGADLAAAAQITRKGAGDSASAATNLQNVLQKISSPATIKAFAKFGVDLPKGLQQAYKEGKTPIEAIADLTNKTLKGDLGKIGFLFEDAQVQQGLRPLIQNMGEYRKIRADAIAAANGNSTTDTDFAERMKDSAEQSKQLGINAKVLAITLGSMLLPTVNAVTAKAIVFANWIQGVAQRHPMLTKALVVGSAAFAALFLVLGGGAIVIAGLIAPVSALAYAAGVLEMSLLPVIGIAALVVAGVVALGAAAYLIYANWGAIGGWFAGLWANIKGVAAAGIGWFASLPARFAEIGRNMIGGLIRGILGMLGNLKGTIVGAAASAADWFKRKLGIHSPSRVFMGFGGFMMDGLSNGIAAGESAPVKRMDRLATRLTSAIALGAATPALATGAAGPSGTAGAGSGARSAPSLAPVTIHIHAAPGESPQEIAKAVRREWDKIQAEQGAKSRGSFADTPDWENG